MTASLLEQLRALIERTYGIDPRLGEIGRYVVGDAGYRALYAGREQATRVDSEAHGARTLVREESGELRACIYYPDRLIHALERRPPQRGLGDDNVDAFAVFVEELDHLMLLAWRRRQGRPLSLFELELQANVTKYLVLQRFLAGNGTRLSTERRVWLRAQLFEKGSFVDADPAVERRYRRAARACVGFLERLPKETGRRLAALRRFYEANATGKTEMAAGIA